MIRGSGSLCELRVFLLDSGDEFVDDVGGFVGESGGESVLVEFVFDLHEFLFLSWDHFS